MLQHKIKSELEST